MMHYVRMRRLAQTCRPETRINYVVRRYGGLDVIVPRVGGGYLHHHVAPNNSPVLPVAVAPVPVAPQIDINVDPGVETSSTDSDDFGNIEPLVDSATRNPFGKFTPLFRGRIVLGANKGVFAIGLFIFMVLTAQIVLEKELIEQYAGGLPVLISGTLFSVLSLVAFFMIGITDPGVVPKNYTLHELLTETEEYRERHPEERFYRYCNKCRTCRPPRTFHCSRCEVCIRQQDTHFFSAGTCVGERNRRAYFFSVLFQTLLAIYLITTNLIIAPNLEKSSENYTVEMVHVVCCSVVGVALLFFPQSGIFMLLYRLYLIVVGRTAREEYRKFHSYNTDDCFVDKRSWFTNIKLFFCGKTIPSVFRRKLNRVDPESLQDEMPSPWLMEHTFGHGGRTPSLRDSHELIHMQNFVEPEDDDDEDILNANATVNNPEAVRLREVASYARGKSTASVPLFEHGLNPPMARIKMPRKSKPVSILQQQINAFHQASQLPKATVSNHRRQTMPVSLSDGCIPRTKDGLPEMIQLSRATQLRRIIQMILLHDREGLIDMSSRVNIAALVGMNRFDPDNLQILELQNGLPMITPRRREADMGNHRLGAGVLGIPQMVAAGLLPTARDLAHSVERMVGRGTVQRLPPVGRQRYTPITLLPPPQAGPGPRRPRTLDEVDRIPPAHNTIRINLVSAAAGHPSPRILHPPFHRSPRAGFPMPRSTNRPPTPPLDVVIENNNNALSEDDDPLI